MSGPTVLGVTGSIGMGKSTVCRMLQDMGVPVHDADAAVHRLMGVGGKATRQVATAFPGVLTAEGAVDRQRLGAMVLTDTAALRRLEAILHPLVGEDKRAFLRRHRLRRTPVVALDVPLLFEAGGARSCDLVVVVSAPLVLQRQRVLARPGMSEERFESILRRQMPDAEKRRRADVVIPSGLGKAVTRRHLRRMVRALKGR
jgi:dephospho-CoA kinase